MEGYTANIGTRKAYDDFNPVDEVFGISEMDRQEHLYCIGKTGSGKSTLLENLIIQDIRAGKGVAFIDPHGDSAQRILDFIPERYANKVVYFNPADLAWPIPLNLLSNVPKDERHLVGQSVMSVFHHVWGVDRERTPLLFNLLQNSILSLLEYQETTLLSLYRLLVDTNYRMRIISGLHDDNLVRYWTKEFAQMGKNDRIRAISSTTNKAFQLQASPVIRNIVGQSRNTFDFRALMDQRKILICNLSQGQIGEESSSLLGALILTKLYLAAVSRSDVEREERVPFYLYVDEFQKFGNHSMFGSVLSEARKYRLSLTLAHQFMYQVPEELRESVKGNVKNKICLEVGTTDADLLAREFVDPGWDVDPLRLANLPRYTAFVRLHEQGIKQPSFEARLFPPEKDADHFSDFVVNRSRTNVARPRIDVERGIRHRELRTLGASVDRVRRPREGHL